MVLGHANFEMCIRHPSEDEGYSICESGTQTGHVVGMISILMVRKETSYDRQWSGNRSEKEESLKWSPRAVEHLEVRKRVSSQQRSLRKGD